MSDLVRLLIYFLGAIRFSGMLSNTNESGPGLILDRIREKAGITYDINGQPMADAGSIGDGMLCPYCSSLWFGLALTILHVISPSLAMAVALPLAISEVVVLKEELGNEQ